MSQRIGKKKRNSMILPELPSAPVAVTATKLAPEPLYSKFFLHNSQFHVFLLFIIGIAVYFSVLEAQFVYDDVGYIRENPAITNFRYLADNSLLQKLPLADDLYKNIILRPVTYFTFACNYYLQGYNVLGYHILNLLVHLANALLVYRLVLLTTRTPFFQRMSNDDPHILPPVLVAFFSALFFVCHPLQTQAVTYITQRFASLAALFYLLSLTLYIQSRLAEKVAPRYLFYTGSFLGAVLAMKSKEIAFTLPVVICLFECMFFRGGTRKRALLLTPFLLTMLIIPVTVIRLSAEMSQGGHASFGKSMNLVNYNQASKLDYLFTQFRVIVTYIRLIFLPVGQNFDHDQPLYTSFFEPQVLLSFALLLALLGTGLYLLHLSKQTDTQQKQWLRLVSFGIFWFFVTLSVESSIIPIDDLLVEQRVYLPSIGFFIAFIAATEVAVSRFGQRLSCTHLIVILSLLAVVLTVTTAVRNTVWRDPITLWQDAARKSPNKSRPHSNLGGHYYERGQFIESLQELKTSLRLDPNNLEARNNVANIYLEFRQLDDAEREYRDLLKLRPDNEKVHNNLGHLLYLKKDYDHALFEYRRALKINPYFLNARFNLAELYEELGQINLAAREYDKALKLNPENTLLRDRLEKLLGR